MHERSEQNRVDSAQTLLQTVRNRSLYMGFISGVIWSALGSMLYYLNFTKISHRSFTLESWNRASWIDTALGAVISIILIGLLSIFVAFIYFVLFKKIKSIWMGIIYGTILWGVVFYVLHPVFSNVPSIQKLEASTIISTLCLYVLYGVFIGYTISYDYAIFKYKKEK